MPFMPLLLLSLVLGAPPPPARDVDIAAPDGTRLRGTYFAPAGPGPAVVLLHMCNTTRGSWEPVARQLSAAGVHALTIDNRGFGDSGGPRFTGARPEVQRRTTDASAFWSAVREPAGAVRATEVFRAARRRNPAAVVFPEPILNRLAYARLQERAIDDAVALFALNAEAYPASANAQDSLADGYLAAGRRDLALAAAKRCLELLPADTLAEPVRTQIREAAEEKIARLGAR